MYGPDLNTAEADRLLELGEFLDREDSPDHERTRDIVSDAHDLLELETTPHEALTHGLGILARGQVDVVTQPGQRDAHQTSWPNWVVNLTSPSTMSRMSVTS